MVQEVQKNNRQLYTCEECGLLYAEKEQAQKCENWCRENHSCNLEIIKDAVKEE